MVKENANILPETDGWDEAANEHPKIIKLRRALVLLSIPGFLMSLAILLFLIPVRITNNYLSGARLTYSLKRYDFWVHKTSLRINAESAQDSKGKTIYVYDHGNNTMVVNNIAPTSQRLLADLLMDSNPVVRREIASVIRYNKSDYMVQTWIKTVHVYDDEMLSWNAFYALNELESPDAIEPLLDILRNSENKRLRRGAAYSLGYCNSPEVINALIKALKNDEVVRVAAADSLGRIGAKEAVPALIDALQHPNPDLRRTICVGLGKIGTEKCVTALIETLNDENDEVKYEAMTALLKIGSSAVPMLINALKSGKRPIRSGASYVLGKIGSKEAISELFGVMLNTENDISIRSTAATGLGQNGYRDAAPVLIEAMSLSDTVIRELSAYLLGKLNSRESIPTLIVALSDIDTDVRYKSAIALVKLGSRESVPVLIDMLSDKDDYIREDAIESLRLLGAIEAVPALQKIVENDSSYSVRQKAVKAIQMIKNIRGLQ